MDTQDIILSFVQDVAFFAELPQPQRRHLCQALKTWEFIPKSHGGLTPKVPKAGFQWDVIGFRWGFSKKAADLMGCNSMQQCQGDLLGTNRNSA
jgi:hypothetical protein